MSKTSRLLVLAPIGAWSLFLLGCGDNQPGKEEPTAGARAAPQTEAIDPNPPTGVLPARPRHVLMKIKQRPTSDRTFVIRGRTTRKPLPARLLVFQEDLGGFMISAPNPAYLMPFQMQEGFLPIPKPVCNIPRSEFIFKTPVNLLHNKLLRADPEFPPLFILEENGELVWVAGGCQFEDIAGERQSLPANRSVDYFIELLRSRDMMNRVEGAYSLGILAQHTPNPQEIVHNLIALLSAQDPLERRYAAHALGAIRNPSAKTPLDKVAKDDPDNSVRAVADYAVGLLAGGNGATASTPEQPEGGAIVSGPPQKGEVTVGGKKITYAYDVQTGTGTYWLPSLFE